MRRTLLMLSLLAFAWTALAPPAAAHTTVATTDGKYLVTAGNLNEPITTFTKTGLDLIVRANTTNRPGITGLHLTLTAVLTAPDGKDHTEPLESHFGKPGSYSFSEPYTLTQAGSYFLKVTGKINETNVDFARILVGSGPVPATEEHMFPDAVQNPKQLQDRIAALEAENAALKADVEALKAKSTVKGESPGVEGFVLLALVGVVGLALRGRRAH